MVARGDDLVPSRERTHPTAECLPLIEVAMERGVAGMDEEVAGLDDHAVVLQVGVGDRHKAHGRGSLLAQGGMAPQTLP
jgi:hypothetical protein